jgi:outer membrane protein assembly factor BamB
VSCALTRDLEGSGAEPLSAKWFTPAGPELTWVGRPALADGVVITAAPGGLGANDTATGQPKWHAQLFGAANAGVSSRSVAVSGHLVCLADYAGVGCADTRTGAPTWTAPASDDSVTQGSSSATDGMRIYYGTRAHTLVARSVQTGAVQWKTDLAPGATFLTRVFAAVVRNDTVFATTVRWLNNNGFDVVGDLVALDAATGRVLWAFTPPADEKSGFQFAPVLVGNLAIVSDVYRHALRAIDLGTRHEVWQSAQSGAGYINSESAPVVVGDTVFAASSDETLYALDVRSGAPLWRTGAAGGSLGAVAPCGRLLVVTLEAGGDPQVVDRQSHVVSRARLLGPGDILFSEPAANNLTAFATGMLGVHAFTCK